jgi:hypothetical protein
MVNEDEVKAFLKQALKQKTKQNAWFFYFYL